LELAEDLGLSPWQKVVFMVDKQVENKDLWIVPMTETEKDLQSELKRLHEKIKHEFFADF